MAESLIVLLMAVFLLMIVGITLYGRYRFRRFLEAIEVVTIENFYSEVLDNKRPIYVFLPPDYRQDEARSYKTLYMNDGQDVAELRLRETLARLMARRRIEPIIVVAIPTNEKRLHEYGTAVTANDLGYGTMATEYANFLTEEIMPIIEHGFRVKAGAANAAIMGISLGGLSAFDIAWNHPHLFGTVGVFSGSFWWRADAENEYITPQQLIAHELVRRSPYRPGFRAWFQAATRDETGDRDNDGVIDAIQDTLELIDELEALGYKRGRDLVYVQVAGGRHNHHTWARVLPQFLEWAFPPLPQRSLGNLPEVPDTRELIRS